MTTASRSIHWSKFFAVLATVLRLGGGLTSFLIQARFLGPYQFGVIGAAMTIAALTSLLSDFGLNTYAMHWGSAQPERRGFLITVFGVFQTKTKRDAVSALSGMGASIRICGRQANRSRARHYRLLSGSHRRRRPRRSARPVVIRKGN